MDRDPDRSVGTFWFGQRVLQDRVSFIEYDRVCGHVSLRCVSSHRDRGSLSREEGELSLAISLSLAFTAVMMVVMPLVIKAVGMDDLVGGAWMGGTIDSTGAVARGRQSARRSRAVRGYHRQDDPKHLDRVIAFRAVRCTGPIATQ